MNGPQIAIWGISIMQREIARGLPPPLACTDLLLDIHLPQQNGFIGLQKGIKISRKH